MDSFGPAVFRRLGGSIRHVLTSNSVGPELLDEEEEEVIRRLDSEALREGLKEVLQSMRREMPARTLLQRRSHGLPRPLSFTLQGSVSLGSTPRTRC